MVNTSHCASSLRQLSLLAVALALPCLSFAPNAFFVTPFSSHGRVVDHRRLHSSVRSKRNNEEGREQEHDTSSSPPPAIGKETSRINSFIGKFIKKKRKEERTVANQGPPPFVPSHLIAIPVEDCHSLQIELESVQRAIAYRCEVLTSACLVPAQLKLPLLYVDSDSNIESEGGGPETTKMLGQIVEEVVAKHMSNSKSMQEQKNNRYDGNDDAIRIVFNDDDDDDDDDVEGNYFVDPTKPKPLLMTFSTLEIDGSNNGQLLTVALPDDKGTKRLQAMVSELKQRVEAAGYDTRYPHDPQTIKAEAVDDNDNNQDLVFRPRLPFMTLPKEFDDNLTHLKNGGADDLDEKDYEYLSCDDGGNGISPIFWCNWWDDVFGTNVRMREIGVYPRTVVDLTSLSEKVPENVTSIHLLQQFQLMYESTALPNAISPSMMREEAEARKYNEERWQEAEDRLLGRNDEKTKDEAQTESRSERMVLDKTRERLEAIYKESIDNWDLGGMEGNSTAAASSNDKDGLDEKRVKETTDRKGDSDDDVDDEDFEMPPPRPVASEDDFIDEWTRQRIRMAIEKTALREERQLAEDAEIRKNLPPIEENPILLKFKNGTLTPKRTVEKVDVPELGPYPTRDHFVGIWQVVSSPTGLEADNDGNDETKSENLILRVDGTTAGGPTFDRETKQKAGGGTWKMIVDNDDDDDDRVQLRIRLVIPPKRERILVMKGDVMRMGRNTIPMASRMFGIPELEERIQRFNERDVKEILQCDGRVHVEDAVTGANRRDIGTFSLLKIHDLKPPTEYIFTVPRPVRSND